MWKTDIITFLTDAWPGVLGHGLTGAALKKKIWSLNVHSVYSFSSDSKGGRVDGTVAGGGGGMILRPEIASKAIDHIVEEDKKSGRPARKTVCFTPDGAVFSQKTAKKWAEAPGIIAICGRYEGIDARFFDARQIETVSLGDFILCGGDSAAMATIEAAVRLLPGTIGKAECLVNESFSGHLLEEPQYTLPRNWEEMEIPSVLLSGDHNEIASWRLSRSEAVTFKKRPDLWKKYCKNERFKKDV